MFKKVKSLLVAGLLVMGMAVPVFANEEGKTSQSIVTDNFASMMEGAGAQLVNGIYVIEKNDMVDEDNWNGLMADVNGNVYDGLRITGENGVYIAYFDEDFDDAEDSTDIKIADIQIDFSKTEEKGIFDITPGTGDAAIAVGGIAVAAVAIGVLIYVNKKEDEE